ncbi:MAG: hypothetical protein U1C96_00575 [Gallionella sp.]|nr:hypothetical protein [Methylobacter sp.]MDP2428384.1 hypothetical protein [Methylobacter sp.]MDP3053072.1 hypothetical protein [Methylobacter sp.]MDP3360702.1 hypothetical protein [Methylobacter sp.]MDZ4200630.1 hypothetical protein [Gallionella sp.]
MQKIDLERISSNTKGMPDCWYIDVNGESSPQVFQKHFGLPRSQRNDKKNIDNTVLRQKRLLHFIVCLLHYRNMGMPIMLTGDKFISPEAHAMTRYDEGWHLRNEEDLIEVGKLDEDDLNTKLNDLLAQKCDKMFPRVQVKIQKLANRANTTVDRAFEVMCKCAIETWLHARNDLANWDNLNDKQKEFLAEVIFCGFTFFGKSALEDVAAIEPSVFAYYRTFLGFPSVAVSVATLESVAQEVPFKPTDELPHRVPKDESRTSPIIEDDTDNKEDLASRVELVKIVGKPDAVSARTALTSDLPRQVTLLSEGALVPDSLQQLYRLIGSLSQEALNDKNIGPKQAQQIQELLDLHLQRLTELYDLLVPEEVFALINRYCDSVLSMIKALDFENSDQRDLVPVLRAAWKINVVAALEDGRPRAWFEVNLRERQQLPEFLEQFELKQSLITAAIKEIENIRVQLTQAKFTARAPLKAKETHKKNEISSAQQELETIRVEAAHYLVPEGTTLDDLMEDESLLREVDIEVEGFSPQAFQNLRAVLFTFDESLESIPQAARPATYTDPIDPAPDLSVIETDQEEETVVSREATDVDIACIKQEPLQVFEDREPTGSEVSLRSAPVVVDIVSTVPTIEIYTQRPIQVVEPESQTEESLEAPNYCVDEALHHMHWAESKEEAQSAFRIAYDHYSQVPSYIAEAVAMHWIEAGHINVAYQILHDANESTLLSDRVLDASLLRSAFYGMNLWPKDRDALSFTQRDLNLLNHKDLEDQLGRKPTGKLVPYLLVCATFQPALFTGGETQAPILLKLAADHFEDHLSRLIMHTAEFTLKGGRLDLDILRNEQAQEVHLAAAKLQDQVNTWVELNQQRTNRWHVLRLALRNCIKHPIIAEAIASIKAGEKGDAAAVRRFRDTYSVHAESRRLLDELVLEIRADDVVDHIDSQAYTIFCQQMDGLVSIAQAWLLEVIPADMRPKDVQDFLQKFHTLLKRSIHNLESHPKHTDLEHRAGSAILLKLLFKLQAKINTVSHNTCRFDQTDATFHLPVILARLDVGDVGVDLRLEWFAMRLTTPNWLSDMLDLARRNQAHWVRFLLLRQLEEISGAPRDTEIDSVINDIAGVRAEFKKAIEQFRNLSLQAMSVDIISEGDHLANIDQVNEWLEKLSERKPYVDVSDIDDEVQLRVRSMEKLLIYSAAQLEDELSRELLNNPHEGRSHRSTRRLGRTCPSISGEAQSFVGA